MCRDNLYIISGMCVCVCACVLYVCVTTQCQCGLNLQAYWIWLQQLGIAQHPHVNLNAWASKACMIPSGQNKYLCVCACVYVLNHKVSVGSIYKDLAYS